MLRGTFTRPLRGPDRIEAARVDGSVTRWTCPSYGGSLPHDLVHVIVESVFELRSGLWGLVEDGLDPATANQQVQAAQRAGHDRRFARDQLELLQAEGLCLMHWYDPELSGESRCEQIARACAELAVDPPGTLTPARADRACALARGLRHRFRQLGQPALFELELTPKRPERTLTQLEEMLRTTV